VFASWRDGDGDIYVMDADGSNLKKLTDNRFEEEFPAWRPQHLGSDALDTELEEPTSVLFIGNSLTFFNGLPQMFAELARSGGHNADVDMSASGGETLSSHATSATTLDKIGQQDWDVVILQEQGGIPAVEEDRNTHMYPAIRLLEDGISKGGAVTVLFMTWGRRDGLPAAGLPGFAAMQAQVHSGYLEIADELGLMVAPVGIAWQNALAQDPQLDLWQEDGGHPRREGSYLAACVFYAVIYQQSPEGLPFRGGVSGETAQLLQAIAAQTVLEDPDQWNIPSAAGAAPRTDEATPEPAPVLGSFVDSGQRLGSGQSWDVALGDLDAFVANAVQGDVESAVWLNDGRGTFAPGEGAVGYGQAVALGDVDGDGDLDALVGSWWGEEGSEVWLNDGAGIFASSGQTLGSGRCFDAALGDLDGDGALDAFVGTGEANTVWLNDGSGAFADSGQRLGAAITAAVALGDVDGDGDLDVVAGGWDEPAKAWLNDGMGGFTAHAQSLSPASVHVHDLALGDVDGDGDLDAFLAVASGDPNQVWLNDGSGAFGDSGQRLQGSLAHGVSVGDVDGDGDLDAFTAHGDRHRGSGGRIWLNDGIDRFADSGLRVGDSPSSSVALGDLDGDGDLDAFVSHGELWQESGGGLPNAVWFNGAP
jgi:hypothetical protein